MIRHFKWKVRKYLFWCKIVNERALTKFLADGKINFEGYETYNLICHILIINTNRTGANTISCPSLYLSKPFLKCKDVRMDSLANCSWEWITHSVLWHALSTQYKSRLLYQAKHHWALEYMSLSYMLFVRYLILNFVIPKSNCYDISRWCNYL